MDYFVKEKFISKATFPIYINGVRIILNQMTKCICKIIKNDARSTGFFCKIPYPDRSHLLPMLVTTYHSLHNLKENDSFHISINDDYEFREIRLNNMRKAFMNAKFDIIFIEIIPEDKINDFLEIDDKIFKEEEKINYIYNKSSVYILHYIKGDKMAVSPGLLKDIYESELTHFCNTECGSTGAPILSLNSFKVIGIHKGSDKYKDENRGTFIKHPISEFIKTNIGH